VQFRLFMQDDTQDSPLVFIAVFLILSRNPCEGQVHQINIDSCEHLLVYNQEYTVFSNQWNVFSETRILFYRQPNKKEYSS
jgi:hypothetical protein